MIPVIVHPVRAVWLAEPFVDVVDIGTITLGAEKTVRIYSVAGKAASRTLLAYSSCDIVVIVRWAKPTVFNIPVVIVREGTFFPALLD